MMVVDEAWGKPIGSVGWLVDLPTILGTNISPTVWHVEDDFPFPKVGCVSSLEGKMNGKFL